MYLSTFQQLDLPELFIMSYIEPLIDFSGERVDGKGYVDLLTTFGEERHSKRINVRYILVKVDTSYNILLG